MAPRSWRGIGLVFGILGACASDPGLKGEEGDLATDGKADGAPGLVEHDEPLTASDSVAAELTTSVRAHAWRFQVTGETAFSLSTSAGGRAGDVDTVLYLYRRGETGWGRHIRRNDDVSRASLWSRIDGSLPAGEYRVVVKSFDETAAGSFSLTLTCDEGRCGTAVPRPDATSIVLPILGESGAPLASFNDALRAQSLEAFPTTVAFTADTLGTAHDRYWALHAYADRDEVYAITEQSLRGLGELGDLPGACFTGDARELGELVQGLSDGFLSDMFTVYGWKTQGGAEFDGDPEGALPEDTDEDFAAAWNGYAGSADEVAIAFASDDEGTLSLATLLRCR